MEVLSSYPGAIVVVLMIFYAGVFAWLISEIRSDRRERVEVYLEPDASRQHSCWYWKPAKGTWEVMCTTDGCGYHRSNLATVDEAMALSNNHRETESL